MTANYCHEHDRYTPCRKCQAKQADVQAIVRSSILAYKEGRNGESYHPGYTEHEAMAWEIGRKEGGWEGKH